MSALVERARQLLAQGDFQAAAASLRLVDIATIVSPRERFEWMILDIEVLLGLGTISAAEARLALAKPTNPAQGSRLALLRARIHAARSDDAAASSTLVAAAQEAATGGDGARTLVEAAWRYAQLVPGHRLSAWLRQAEDPSERAWWQLIQAFNEALTAQQQQTAWDHWRTRHPEHVAARFHPSALVDIDPGPARIALLLPFSGLLANAGETVRDGFLSAYFVSAAPSRQSIHVYDTAAASVATLYRQALEDGADAIVGPLSKQNAADMWALDPTVPTLTLNTVTARDQERSHPIQFALTVEDEARAIAKRVVADGHRRVIVLRSGENWTARAFTVLSDHLAWNNRIPGSPATRVDCSMGGERGRAGAFSRGARGDTPRRGEAEGDGCGALSSSSQPGSRLDELPADMAPVETQLVRSGVFLEGADITSVVGETLLIEASKQRHLHLERMAGEEVEFTPRRRQDVDAVIALIEGGQLASLKPALAFHFASDLPIYASSQAGRDVPNHDDLERLRICDMPWRLYPPPMKAELREAFPNNRGTADALFAFGLDAYRLVNQMSRLTASTDSRIMGSTGILQLAPDGVIRREPVWALVEDGRFVPLAPDMASPPRARDADVATTGR